MTDTSARVVVLFNHVDEDEYEKIRHVDPSTLGFEPEYDIHVATVMEEYGEVVKALRRAGFKARAVNLRDDIKVLQRLVRRPPDVVFNMVEHFRDDPELESDVAGFLDLHQVAYTGSPPFALSLCRRKGLAKHVMLAQGVPTPRYRILLDAKIPRRHGLHYPLIVKPSREDASAGVERESVVYDYPGLLARIEHVFEDYGPPILVEEFIEGRELHVAVWGNDEPEVLPIIEFDFSDLPADVPNIISYDAKWNPLKEEFHRVFTVCPARLSKRALRRVRQAALAAYHATGCRDYARLDLRLTKQDHPFVLEVNPNPDLTEGVSFMEAAEQEGYEFEDALRIITELALGRMPEPEEPEEPSESTASAEGG
ncbi:MAG: D-alanine--D-alanine ligase [Gemmatimonadota bacterium]|nr:D-alanine--D-alanine ligase [Gemmatimonadota bacterium]